MVVRTDLTVLRKPYEKIGFPATATVRFLQRSSEHKDNIALGSALSYHGRMYTDSAICVVQMSQMNPEMISKSAASPHCHPESLRKPLPCSDIQVSV